MTAFLTAFYAFLGVIFAITVLRLGAAIMAGLARLAVWFDGYKHRCGARSPSEQCVLREGHFGPHAGPIERRTNGKPWRVRFVGTKWDTACTSWGENL